MIEDMIETLVEITRVVPKTQPLKASLWNSVNEARRFCEPSSTSRSWAAAAATAFGRRIVYSLDPGTHGSGRSVTVRALMSVKPG